MSNSRIVVSSPHAGGSCSVAEGLERFIRSQPLNPLEPPDVKVRGERSETQPTEAAHLQEAAPFDPKNPAHLAVQHSATFFNQGDSPVNDTDA